MSLRIVEVILPTDHVPELTGLLDERPLLGLWTSSIDETKSIARALVPMPETEALTDQVTGPFSHLSDFRLMLFTVEATIPMPAESSPEEDEEGEGEAGPAPPQRISREELYHDVEEGASLSWTYVAMVALSTLVATFGLMRDDVAIIIGAMVIAPLLGPNIGLALASTLGDAHLALRSARTSAAGVATAAALAFLVGLTVAVDPEVPAIAVRTHVNMGDVVLALAAGVAGALAFTTGIPTGIIGVMVAVALLPPLVIAGLLYGAGYASLASGALLLGVTNVTCVNLAAVGTFLSQRIRPRTWWEAERARKATRIAVASWVAMLVLLVAIILLVA